MNFEYDDPTDDCCSAWYAEYLRIPPEVEGIPDNSDQKFYIMFEIEFNKLPRNPEWDDDGNLLMPPNLDTSTILKPFWFESRRTEGKHLAWRQVANKLAYLGVPLLKQMPILSCISKVANEIVKKPANRNRSVFPLMLSVSLIVTDRFSVREDFGDDPLGMEEYLGTLPATDQMMQQLHTEVIQPTREYMEICPICKEELEIGCRTRRLPCTHDFHENCLFNWLEVTKSCPICWSRLDQH